MPIAKRVEEGINMPGQKIAPIENLQRSLGRRIRELRSKHGWTQEQFAEFCGLHRTYLGHVERGEKNVSLSTVLRVANALGVRISSLFGRSEKAPVAPDSAHLRPPLTGPSATRTAEVNRLLDELQTQRKALRGALRQLSNCLARVTDSAS
jgi:transcriptional regulator with XRE-family HTH domain